MVAVLPNLIGKEGESIHCKSHELLLSPLSPQAPPYLVPSPPSHPIRRWGLATKGGVSSAPKAHINLAIRMQLLDNSPRMYQCNIPT